MQAYSAFLFSVLAVLFHSLHTCFLSLFPGGTGPTSDTGWGCMLRCGQMIFAQALVCRHLGRGKAENWLPGPCARISAVLLRIAAGNCWGLCSFSLSFLRFRADVWKLYWKLSSRFLPAAVCISTQMNVVVQAVKKGESCNMLAQSTDAKQVLGFSWRAFLNTWSLKSPTKTTCWLVSSLVFNLSRSPLFVSSLFCLKSSVLALEPYLVCIGFLWWL